MTPKKFLCKRLRTEVVAGFHKVHLRVGRSIGGADLEEIQSGSA
jgi:hypothetical protein